MNIWSYFAARPRSRISEIAADSKLWREIVVDSTRPQGIVGDERSRPEIVVDAPSPLGIVGVGMAKSRGPRCEFPNGVMSPQSLGTIG